MIGPRVGVTVGSRVGTAAGVSSDEISIPSAQGFTGFGILWGQSNIVGFANYAASGTSAIPAGDLGYAIDQPFAGATLNQNSATAPASPMVYNIDTGSITLQAYAAAGGNNHGLEHGLGRYLKNHCGLTPVMCKLAVASSSIPGHWLQSSAFPASGEKLYDHWIAYGNARMAEFGRKFEYAVQLIGETDCATPARVTSAVADINTHWNAAMDAWGLGSTFHIVLILIHSAQSSGDVAGYRAQQQAWAAQWTRCGVTVIDPSADVPLAADPHYGMTGYIDVGERVGVALRKQFLPTQTGNLSSGPAPWLQQASPGYTCQASPSVAKPRTGPDPKAGDIEILVAASYTAAATITLTVAAGFSQLGTQFESVLTTNHRTLAVFTRTVDQATLDANGGRMPIPQVDCQTATLDVARIFTIRGASGIDTTSQGVNNANSTALTIAGGTTTNANCLAFIIMLTAGTTNSVSTIVNASMTNIVKQWDCKYNPGAGTVGMAVATATLTTAGAYNATSVTFAAAGVNAGMVVAFKP